MHIFHVFFVWSFFDASYMSMHIEYIHIFHICQVDLRAKVMRTKSLLDDICGGRRPETMTYDKKKQDEEKGKS